MGSTDYNFSNHRLRVYEDDDGKDYSKVEVQTNDSGTWTRVATFALPTDSQWFKAEVTDDSSGVKVFRVENNLSRSGMTATLFKVNANPNWKFGDSGDARASGIGVIDIRGSKTVTLTYFLEEMAIYMAYDSANTEVKVASPAFSHNVQ